MHKPGRARLSALCRQATTETGVAFRVDQESRGEYKGTVRYVYLITRKSGNIWAPVTPFGAPSYVEAYFTNLLDHFRSAQS